MIKVTVDTGTHTDQIFISRLSYVLDFIQNHPCTPEDVVWTKNNKVSDVSIGYCGSIGQVNFPHINDFCFDDVSNKLPRHISLLYKNELNIYGFTPEQTVDHLSCPIDIFQTIFFHISRYEEWFARDVQKDFHGLMSSDEHLLVRRAIHDTPVVDHLVFYLYELLKLNPKKRPSSFRLTHDIDAIRRFPSFYKFLRANANILFYQKSKWTLIKKLCSIYRKVVLKKESDPYDTFDWLLNTNSSKIIDRKIYFLSGGKTKYENFYKIDDPKCAPIFKLSVENHYDFGIHPSYMSGQHENMIVQEKSSLEKVTNQKIIHSRQHFLKYNIKETSKILEKIGISTDSSLGYRNKTGFRCGTGFPYKLYNFETEKPFTFEEIPLVVMDMAIIHEVGWDVALFKSHLDTFLKKNEHYTQITFNFHNSTFDPVLIDAEELKSYYIKLFGHQSYTKYQK
jgi:hypothetical protein